MRTLQEQMKMAVELKEQELELRKRHNEIYELTEEEVYNFLNDETKENLKKYENEVFQPLPTLADFMK